MASLPPPPAFPPHLPTSTPFPRTQLLLFPSTPTTTTSTFLCQASSTPPPSPSSSATPSLSDQLLPLSLTLLNNPPPPPSSSSPTHLHPKPKSTWVNPSKPKPKVLSLRRHRRPPLAYNPDLKNLSAISSRLAGLPDDADRFDPEAFSAALADLLPDPPSPDASLLILNSLRPWNKAYHFFLWLSHRGLLPQETIFYNVAIKNLRFGRRFDLAEALAGEMMDAGVELDNVTYSTLITCAKRCRLFDRAIDWFDRMYKAGVVPDEVTYSAILDVYAKLGRVEEVISLYERGRASGWKPDAVAFSVLGKMFGEARDYDGIRYVLQEMSELGVEPNVVVYNTLLEAMGKAGKPGLARSLFDEMLARGLIPNELTLTALIKIYGKARWSRDALELWERMKANNWPMDFILYNTLLSMCADLGIEEEAEKLFEEMKKSGRCRPDSWSYTAMVNIYASAGKVEKALGTFEEMLEKGVEPNIMSCTCLIQSFGKAGRIDDAVRVFDVLIEKGIKPDDRLCGCLLSVVAVCEESEMCKVLACLEKANSRLVALIRMLGKDRISFDAMKDEFRGIMTQTDVESRRPFCNCLIDICRNQNFPSPRAQELFSLGSLYGLYPGLYTKVTNEWSLNLRSLSVGAACTAFEEWIRNLGDCKSSLPPVFSIHTGTGSHKLSQGLATSFAAYLEEWAAPFKQNEVSSGHFFAMKDDLIPWMKARMESSAAAT